MTSTANDGDGAIPMNAFVLAEHRLLRETLVRLLQKKADVRVSGEGRRGDSTVEHILASQCNVLLMDSPGVPPPRKMLGELFEKAPAVRVILFGMEEDHEMFLEAVRVGVKGYILKDASAGEIIDAVRSVARGEAVCPPRLCMGLFETVAREYQAGPRITYQQAHAKFGLTPRQSQLMALVERGLTNKEIASKLNLSEFTVKNHLRRIMRQVDAGTRFEAVDAIRAGSAPLTS